MQPRVITSALRTFPYATDLADGPTHHLVAMNPALQHGTIFRFLHGDDHHLVTGEAPDLDALIDDVATIHRHRTFSGVLTSETILLTAVFGAFVALPPPVQDTLVEWILELLPLPGVFFLSLLARLHEALGALKLRGRDYDVLVLLVATWCILVLAVVLWRAAKRTASGPRAAARALRAKADALRAARRRRRPPPEPATDEQTLCAVCLERPREVVFSCDHFVVCQPCANAVAECPVCREPVTERRRIFPN